MDRTDRQTSAATSENGLEPAQAILRALAEGTTDVIFVKGSDRRYRMINSAGARAFGLTPEEVVGRTDEELLPPAAAQELQDHDRSVMASGEAETYEETMVLNGDERIFQSTKVPYRDDGGRIIGVIGIARDITERKALEREREHLLARERAGRAAATFMAEASAVLDSSLDYTTTLKNVAQLAIPEIADWCAVDILGSEGELDHVALAHADPEMLKLAEEWRAQYPPDPDAPHGPAHAMRTGESLLYPDIPDELLRARAEDPRQLELLRGLGFTSAMVVPMRVRRRSVGAITFVSSRRNRRYGPEDLRLAEEVARRAAVAVENARLYSERSYIAQTLQRSLLPPILPAIPGVEVAARFHAAGEGYEVGGDFYDLFETPDDRWVAVIGDVCGKGADAAAITALARYTIRANATHEASPARVLALLNDAMLRDRPQDVRRFCTAAMVLLHPRDGGVTVATGGHPLPFILRRDGTVEEVGRAGTLLGIVEDVEITNEPAALDSGDTLVLYTDGVVEARSGSVPPLGELGLARLLSGCADSSAEDVAERLEEAALEAYGGRPGDDIAVLVLRRG